MVPKIRFAKGVPKEIYLSFLTRDKGTGGFSYKKIYLFVIICERSIMIINLIS